MDWDMKGNRFWMVSAILAVIANLFVLLRNTHAKILKKEEIQKQNNKVEKQYLIMIKNMLDTYLAYLFVTNNLAAHKITVELIGISIGCINMFSRK